MKIQKDGIIITDQHEEKLYKIIQTTHDFCGNTLEAAQDFCDKNGLDWEECEYIRLAALQDYPDNAYA